MNARGRRVTVNAGPEVEVAFLIAAARQAVSLTSIRAVAKGAGLSHGTVFNLVNGRTRKLSRTTIAKLREWYVRQWSSIGDGLTPEGAAYLMEQILAAIPPNERIKAAFELVQALERIYDRHRTERPAWLPAVRADCLRRR
jgi:transcriptional regulator with XRE-family HTH domain